MPQLRLPFPTQKNTHVSVEKNLAIGWTTVVQACCWHIHTRRTAELDDGHVAATAAAKSQHSLLPAPLRRAQRVFGGEASLHDRRMGGRGSVAPRTLGIRKGSSLWRTDATDLIWLLRVDVRGAPPGLWLVQHQQLPALTQARRRRHHPFVHRITATHSPPATATHP